MEMNWKEEEKRRGKRGKRREKGEKELVWCFLYMLIQKQTKRKLL